MLYALTALIFLMVGIWVGKGYPMPNKQENPIEPITTIDETAKKKEEAIKEQWENLFNYDGSAKQ